MNRALEKQIHLMILLMLIFYHHTTIATDEKHNIVLDHYSNEFNCSYTLVNHHIEPPEALECLLYGYNGKITQRESLEYLLHQSKILQTTEHLEKIFPHKILENADMLQNINKFIDLTQKHFVVRSNNQERWQLPKHNWINEENKSQIVEALKQLAMIDKILPTKQDSDAICILGATTLSMKNRVSFASTLLQNGSLKAKYLILLSGERYASLHIDGTEKELSDIATKYKLTNPAKVTETMLLEQIYNSSNLYNKLQTFIVDTPSGSLPRPTTETTIVELLQLLKQHKDIRHITFISNQPYVKYQQAVIYNVLNKHNVNISFDVVGDETDITDKTLTNAIGGFGSYIWTRGVFIKKLLNM